MAAFLKLLCTELDFFESKVMFTAFETKKADAQTKKKKRPLLGATFLSKTSYFWHITNSFSRTKGRWEAHFKISEGSIIKRTTKFRIPI